MGVTIAPDKARLMSTHNICCFFFVLFFFLLLLLLLLFLFIFLLLLFCFFLWRSKKNNTWIISYILSYVQIFYYLFVLS